MRTSFLSRSVIAVASLAIGSVALAATPATAAAPEGVTRDLVLTAAHGLYANEGAMHSPPENVIESYEKLVSLACDFHPAGLDRVVMRSIKPFVTGNADGILTTVQLFEPSLDDGSPGRFCTFAALATTDAAFALSGNLSLSITGEEPAPRLSAAAQDTVGATLSGNVFVTTPINVDYTFGLRSASLTTSGNATRSVNVTTPHKVTTPKSKSAKKAAKKKYDKAVKKAEKAYSKAVKKAGSSKSKKASAKKAYAKKRAAAKNLHNKAIVTVKTVNKTAVRTENRPFTIYVNLETGYAG